MADDELLLLSSFPPPLDCMARDVLHMSTSSILSSDPLPPASERLDNLEIALRSHVLSSTGRLVRIIRAPSSSIWKDGNDCGIGDGNKNAIVDILRFIRAALDLCALIVRLSKTYEEVEGEHDDNKRRLVEAAAGMGGAARLPFLLLEDAIDTLPLSLCKVLWVRGIEAWADTLTDPNTLFMPGCKLVFLRLCNKFLTRKLSRERNAEFSGRVLMFMASAYPLSERSGLNLLGKFNVENVTDYEDENTFELAAEGHRCQMKEERECEEEDGGGVKDSDDCKEGVVDSVVDYDMYRKFWGMQKFMSDPNKALLDDIEWEEFSKGAKSVLYAFEGHPFPRETLKQSRERWLASKKPRQGQDKRNFLFTATPRAEGRFDDSDGMKNDTNKTPTNGRTALIVKSSSAASRQGCGEVEEDGEDGGIARHQKYLTSSQLLRLQLRDPELRLQFLSQLLVVSFYFLSSSLSSPASTKQKGVSDGKEMVMTEGRRCDLGEIRKRIEDLMRATPPNGGEHLDVLLWLLDSREPGWRQWKDGKCQSFERYGGSGGTDDEVKLIAERRADLARKDTSLSGYEGRNACAYAQFNISKDLPVVSQQMSKSVPLEDEFLEDYVEAMDPDSGIEDAYHPKNDALFSWRALRLLSRDHLSRFGEIRTDDGDFEDMVRSVWKADKGIDIPAAQEQETETTAEMENIAEGQHENGLDEVPSSDEEIKSKQELEISEAMDIEKDDSGGYDSMASFADDVDSAGEDRLLEKTAGSPKSLEAEVHMKAPAADNSSNSEKLASDCTSLNSRGAEKKSSSAVGVENDLANVVRRSKSPEQSEGNDGAKENDTSTRFQGKTSQTKDTKDDAKHNDKSIRSASTLSGNRENPDDARKDKERKTIAKETDAGDQPSTGEVAELGKENGDLKTATAGISCEVFGEKAAGNLRPGGFDKADRRRSSFDSKGKLIDICASSDKTRQTIEVRGRKEVMGARSFDEGTVVKDNDEGDKGRTVFEPRVRPEGTGGRSHEEGSRDNRRGHRGSHWSSRKRPRDDGERDVDSERGREANRDNRDRERDRDRPRERDYDRERDRGREKDYDRRRSGAGSGGGSFHRRRGRGRGGVGGGSDSRRY